MSLRLPAPERRQQLLDTALATYARLGYNDASMNDIAEAAGVTKPVLYQHFASKRELFLELLADVAGRLRAAVRDAAASAATGGPRAQVEAGFSAWFNWVDTNRDGFTVLFDSEVRRDPEFSEQAAKVQREMADTVAEFIVADGLTPERRRLLAYGIVGLGESTCRRWLEKEIDLDADELAVQVGGLAWSGLRGVSPT
ncbi:MAG: TetR/AcrR family transcriptional regulator [Acidimicrobiales bacterium]